MASPRNLMIVRYVHDMARAYAFHRDGLGLAPIAESAGWSMLSCGDAMIGLHAIYSGVSERPVGYAGLNLEVDDLDAAIARAVRRRQTGGYPRAGDERARALGRACRPRRERLRAQADGELLSLVPSLRAQRLKELDGRIFEQDLLAADAGDDLVAEPGARRLQNACLNLEFTRGSAAGWPHPRKAGPRRKR